MVFDLLTSLRVRSYGGEYGSCFVLSYAYSQSQSILLVT